MNGPSQPGGLNEAQTWEHLLHSRKSRGAIAKRMTKAAFEFEMRCADAYPASIEDLQIWYKRR